MTRPTDRPTPSPRPARALTTMEMLVSATGLTLLMLVMIEAVFLFW